MRKCKACGEVFGSTDPTDELCFLCERALKRLNGYAVPVVRCKDCKKWLKIEPSGTNCRYCAVSKRSRLPYDF